MGSGDGVSGLLRRVRSLIAGWGEADPGMVGMPVTFLPPRRRCRLLLLCTKRLPEEMMWERRPAGVGVVIGAGVLDACSREMIVSLVRRWGCEVSFVGDLDPADLVAFVVNRERLQEEGVVLRYGGVGGQWTRVCQRYYRCAARGRSGGELPVIAMRDTEKQLAVRLLDEVPGLVRVIGRDAAALLKGGDKLEVEGAANPGMYRKGFAGRLAVVLFGGLA